MSNDKFSRAFLHFGGDKTGSTTIQVVLDTARQLLLKTGLVAYPPGWCHAQLGSYLCGHPEQYHFNMARRVGDLEHLADSDRRYRDELVEWIERAPKCGSLVFSYEGFSDLEEDALGRFKEFCENYATIVTIVLYVRAPLSYAISAMSQRVKQGRKAWSGGDLPIILHSRVLEKLALVFGKENVCVRLFSPEALRSGDVVVDFMSIIGLPEDVIGEISACAVRTNESLSWPALCFGERLIDGLAQKGLDFSEAEFNEAYGQHLGSIAGEPIRLAPEQVDELSRAARPHSEYLEQHYGIVFREDTKKYLQVPGGKPALSVEFMASVAKVMVTILTHNRQCRPDFSAPEFVLLGVELHGSHRVEFGQVLCFEVKFSLAVDVGEMVIGIHIFDEGGRWAFGTNTTLLGISSLGVARGTHRVRYYLLADLPEGRYTAGFAFAERRDDNNRDVAWYDKLVTFLVSVARVTPSVGYVSLPVEFDYRQTSNGFVGLIERANGTIGSDAVVGDVCVGEVLYLPVRLSNASTQTWMGSFFHPINLCYKWLDLDDHIVVSEGERTLLPDLSLAPGESTNASLRVVAPSTAGCYRLLMVPLQEGQCWFHERGFSAGTMEIEVRALGEARRYPALDSRLLPEVGERVGSAIVSTGREGLLFCGPCAQLAAGRYVARVEGGCEPGPTGVWVSIATDKGSRVLARHKVSENAKMGCIAELPFTLAERVADLEVRLWVTAEASVCVETLHIKAIGLDTPALQESDSDQLTVLAVDQYPRTGGEKTQQVD